MRGIRKPWPPVNVSRDGEEAVSLRVSETSFLAWLAAGSRTTQQVRNRFEELDKKRLRTELYREQHYVCVYCERRVDENLNISPVEHWRPLSQDPEHALEWENLYLSCPTSETCDDAKEGRRLAWDPADPSLPWPTQQAYENWVGCTSGGKMFVRADALLSSGQRQALELAIEDRDDGIELRRSILNLNHAALVAARKAAIDSEKSRLDRDYPGRHAAPEDRDRIAAEMLQRPQRPAFVSVRVAWLQRTLGQGRP
jgi:uncharacterized protein (TIGR02646 family)